MLSRATAAQQALRLSAVDDVSNEMGQAVMVKELRPSGLWNG